MSSGGDDRAISELAGAVLLFAALIITLSLYQATVVPTQNSRVEFDHNQRVQDDIQNLRGAILNAPNVPSTQAVAIELGVRYPTRQLLINPAPPAGTLRTEGTEPQSPNITILNATASGEVGDFWTGSTRQYTTRAISYRPTYNQYTNSPITHYENSVVYNQFNNTQIAISTQAVVDGRRITLISIAGNLSKNGIREESVDVQSMSPGQRTVAVSDSGGPVSITIPTRLSLSTWQELFKGEFVANGTGGHIVDLSIETVPNTEFNRLTIELETGVTYELRLARVIVGNQGADADIGYVAPVTRNITSITTDEKQLLVAEVRDRLDNPKSGVNLTFTTTNGTFSNGATSIVLTSDVNGQAGAVLSATTTGNATVRAGIDQNGNGALDDENQELFVTYTVFIQNSS